MKCNIILSILCISVGTSSAISTRDTRNAEVKLLTCDLSRFGTVSRVIGGSFSFSGEGGKHWAIVTQFDGDDEVYVSELYVDPDVETQKGSGGIKWHNVRMTKEEALRGKTGISVYNLGRVSMTEQQLKNYCSNISINNKDYHLLLQNCQSWVKELVGKMGLTTVYAEIKGFLMKVTGPGFLYSYIRKNDLN